MLIRVVLLIPETAMRRRIRAILSGTDIVVDLLRGKRHFWERAARRSFDMLIAHESTISADLANSVDLVRELPDRPAIVLLVDEDRAGNQARFLATGVNCVLYTGLDDEVLASAIHAELSRRRVGLEPPSVSPAQPGPQLSDFVSQCPAMRAFVTMAGRVARTDSSVLIQGETGVGKEHLARAIHTAGQRRHGPFVAVNCGGLPESLMEAELFGHEAGAFTGATRGRRGYFELAHDGTIFLDEIGEVPPHLQVKLLRVLQEREIRRLGSERSVGVDIRVIAATNRDLVQDMQSGRFRSDLYYRLSVVTLTIPPLRDRKADIPALVNRAAERLAPRVGLHRARISDPAMRVLREYDWPGNIRELSNIVERALLLSEAGLVDVDCLPPGLAQSHQEADLGDLAGGQIPEVWLAKPLPQLRQEIIEHLERSYLSSWLDRTGGRVGRTARAAGIQPRTLFEKMKRYQLRKEHYRHPTVE